MNLSSSSDLALVGCGYWGKNLARNFHELGVLRTICDPDPAAVRALGSAYACVNQAGSVEELLKDVRIAKVAIAAPAVQHFKLARLALESGKDVFVEKPLCLEIEEARELVAMAKKLGRILMVGHLLQYHPYVQKLREIVTKGELGKLNYITSNRLHLGKFRREENALWSFAPHDISVILSLCANELPNQVRCTGDAYLNRGVADVTLTTLRFMSGMRAHVYVSWLNPFKEQKLVVVGSQGMAVFDDTRPWNEKLMLHRDYMTWTDGQVPTVTGTKGETIVVPECEPLREECLHFLSCCHDRRPPRTDGVEGLRVLSVLRAAHRSLELDGEAMCPDEPEAKRAIDSTVQASPPCSPARDYSVHPTAVIDEGAVIGRGTKIWHFSHIMKGAQIGERCVLGQNVNVDGGTKIGNNVKIQNNVSVYAGVEMEDDVFLGPSCVLTNVTNPRSQINRHSLYEKTLLKRGATIGANASIVCGVTIGRYAFVGAGAVVTKDVADYALVVGNPARQTGWISRHGHMLSPDADGLLRCPESGLAYQETETGVLRCLDLDEEAALSPDHATGKAPHSKYKTS